MNQKLNCILVIDDDEPTNFFTEMILENADCARHTRVMTGGKNALGYLSKCAAPGSEEGPYYKPDLIFLDINMPAMDGWEFLDAYKKLNSGNMVPVIMLTTSQFPADKLRAAAMPEIIAFENKPLTEENVLAAIQKYFATHNAP